jgi:hypothetical protein
MAQSARKTDLNGFIEIKNNPISKVGVFPYLGKNIDKSLEPDKIYYVYRPEEELNNPECIESFKLLPWISDHVMLGSEDSGLTSPDNKGVRGVVGEDVYFSDGYLYGNLKLFSDNLGELIDSGEKKELSAGYRCKYELISGNINGKEYHAIQRNIRGNHLASVNEGRMGKEVAVLDHLNFTFDAKDYQMPEEEVKKEEEKKPEIKEEGKKSETKSMGVDDVVTALEKLLPLIKQILAVQNKEEIEPVKDGEKIPEKDPADKETVMDEEFKKDDEKKENAMDAAIIKKSVITEMAQVSKLADKLSHFVGTFDHSDMGLQDVAKYGAEKLGIACDKGQELAALQGYLHGRDVPAKASKFGMDAKDKASNVQDFFAQKA